MDEEKEQKNGQAQEPKSALGKAGKKLKEQGKRKIFKKVIAVLVPILLKTLVGVFIIFILVSSIKNFLDGIHSEESKNASSSAISYGKNAKKNKINVNVKNVTANGAYKLTYKFKDNDGKTLTEDEAIQQIKKDLEEENEKINLNKFSDSELKIIGSLMYNGLETGKYNEEQLKALAIFVKADIAGRKFDLRAEKKEVSVEALSKNDEVYGTLELHKMAPVIDTNGNVEYKDVKLTYVPYDTLKSMIGQNDKTVLNKFSLDSSGKLIIAKSSTSNVKYTFFDVNGKEVENIEGISQEYENENKYNIKEYPISVNYEPYIKKYIETYGFLSDLLIATNNVDFCLDIAELAFNSKIVLTLREEKIEVYVKEKTSYHQTNLFYDYVTYEMTGYKVNMSWENIVSGNGDPSNSSVLKSYGWRSSLSYVESGEYGRTNLYSWSKDGESYRLNYANTSTYKKWTLYKRKTEKTETQKNQPTTSLIVGGHVTESYADYTIDEDYTAKEEINYTIFVEQTSTNYRYDIDISEIDCWYLTYKRPYAQPTQKVTSYSPPQNIEGEYPQEAEVVLATTNDASIIGSDEHVIAFSKDKETDYVKNNSNVDEAECKVTELTINKKSKRSSEVLEYVHTKIEYKFGDEEELDITQAQFKNVEYIGEVPSYVEDSKGFLYVYDRYLNANIDLCLHNDDEKKFFEMLEADSETVIVSDIMKFLLYVYDGIDRGIIDFDKNFKVIDISLIGGGGISPFGCPLTKEEFIEATKKYQGNSTLATLAEKFYDICTLPEYNVNPCLAYVWAAYESGWGRGEAAVLDKNLFSYAIYNGETRGKKYASYDDSIKDFCQWVVNAADVSTSSYSNAYTRAQEFATVNDKFRGTPDKNIYALFCRYAWVGDTHTPDARACIKNTYAYLNDGIYVCNHSDSEETSLQERADYADYTVTSRVNLAKTIFGKNCFLGHGSIVEAAYEVADHFMNSGVDVHYAAADIGGNNIYVTYAYSIEDSYNLPIENPYKWGIVCTTFVNLALWKAEIVDAETLNQYNIHSPVFSDMMLKSLEGWEIITDYDELQEGDVVYSDNHTWIYIEGDKMLDQSYCVISSDGSDTRGILKNPNRSKFIRGFRYVG